MRKRATRNILLILWEHGVSARDFFSGFMQHAHTRQGWNVSMLYGTEAFLPATIQSILNGKYDGIVLTENMFNLHPEFGRHPNTSVVVIGSYEICPELPEGRFACVRVNNREIGRRGARYLLSLGKYRSYAFFPPAVSEDWSRLRAAAFCQELEANRIKGAVFDHADALSDWLKAIPKPAAIMAACDYTAVKLISACIDNALSIPHDIAIIGVDNDELICEFTKPALTTIQPELHNSGFQAAKTLDALLRQTAGRGHPGRRPQVVDCNEMRIIERESTRSISPAVHLIQAAVAFVRNNIGQKVTVTDVVRHLGVSRRLLDLRFREYHDRSVLDMITSMKLEELSKRLLMTDRTIRQIAASLGFDDLAYLGRLFRKHYGVSMSEWRDRSGNRAPMSAPSSSPPSPKAT